jgi:alpha-1,2-mannosyltransferase
VFLGDASYTGASLMPGDPFLVHHSCLTAYMHGAILSMDPAANVYDMAFVDAATREAPLPATAAHLAPFKLDAFGYPPPFLLLPRALLLLSGDFMVHRAWFGATSLLLTLFACAAVARTLGGLAGRRIWLLAPLFMASASVLVTLQIGNFHLFIVALCLLCWVALERRRDGLAGVLLAVAILAKISPGLLGVLLLTRRRWRAVGVTVASAMALVALSVVVLGTQVWRDFLFYQLPKIQSGEALRFLAESDQNIRFNIAPFGIPFKLAALGLEGWGWAQARTFASVYTVLLLVLAALAGLNDGPPRHRLAVWLAIVMFASLRSPYAAPFVVTTVILLLLVMTAEVRSWGTAFAFAITYAIFSFPMPITDPWRAMAWSLTQVGLLYLLLLRVTLRRAQPEPEAVGQG